MGAGDDWLDLTISYKPSDDFPAVIRRGASAAHNSCTTDYGRIFKRHFDLHVFVI